MKKTIDNVTITNLDLALRMCGMSFDHKTINKIIDLVDLLEQKGDHATLKDICDLKSKWK